MKNVSFYFICLFITTSALANPNPDLQRTFAQAFPSANNVKWSDDKDGYFVSFIENGNWEKVFYNKTGNLVCLWKYSDGSELPGTVLFTIGKNYKNFEILGVTEFSTPTDNFFEIKLSTNRYWYAVKVSPYGEILEKKRYNK